MSSPSYHFVTQWRVRATPQEVYAIIEDSRSLVEWWPSVYLQVEEIQPGDANGIGREVSLLTKGMLPYTLRWRFVTSEKKPYESITLYATGDFIGRGIWTFTADGADCDIDFDWEITAEKPLLRWLTPLLRGFFSANHRWAMRQGEASLRLELERRRLSDPAARASVPKPPGPYPVWPWIVDFAVGIILLMLFWWWIH